MSTKDNGGPAFPTSHSPQYPSELTGGMTLRDYFAAKASDADVGEIMSCHFDYYTDQYTITRQQARYMHADAMLSERAR